MKRISSHRNEILLFLALLVSFTYFFPRWADPNQNSRLNMVFAVVEDGTFQIDRFVENTVDYAEYNGHYYSDKAPGMAFLGIPVYKVMKTFLDLPWMDGLMIRLSNSSAFQSTLREGGSGIYAEKVKFALAQVVLSFLLSALPTALSGVLIYSASKRITPDAGPRAAAVIGYALLTPVFAYANAFYGHMLAAALLFGAFYIAWTGRKPLSLISLAAIGALLAYAFVTEYPSFLVAGIIVIYSLYQLYRTKTLTRAVWMVIPAALIGAGWLWYNNSVFGGPLKLGYSGSTLWEAQHSTGFMSLTWPHWEAAWGMSFGVFRGLFVLSPLLLLAVPGFVLWFRSKKLRAEAWVSLLSVLVFLLFNASSIMWWGGFSIGPRYLLPALPFAALGLVFVFAAWGRLLWMKMLAGLTFAWSAAATWGMSLAGQAFPPDTIRNPYTGYLLPNWLEGNLARSFGTILGLQGLSSLAPLLLVLAALALIGWLYGRRRVRLDSAPGLIENHPPITQG
jgi:hypothetical protein